jgi:adenylate cyclase
LGQVSFRSAQLLLLLVVLLTTAGVIGASAYYNARFAVDHLAAQVVDQTTGRVEQRAAHLLDLTATQAALDVGLMEEGSLDPSDPARLAEYFLAALRAHPELSYLSFTRAADGVYVHVFHDPSGDMVLQRIHSAEESRRTEEFRRVGHAWERVHFEASTDRDQRTRPYYVAAAAGTEPVWTETYTFIGRANQADIPGLTRATPVLDDGELVGVLTADIDLRALSAFLDAVPVGDQGYAFLVEHRSDGHQRVVAHPDAGLLTRPDADGRPTGVAMADIEDPVVRALADSFAAPAVGGRFRFEVDGTYWMGSRRPIGAGGPQWSIATVVPEADVMGPVHRMNRITFLVILGGVGLALVLGMQFSRLISEAVDEVTGEMHRIARFDLSGPSPDRAGSMIQELSDMREATDTTKQGLRSFGKYVPRDLVHQLLQGGGEARLGAVRRELTVLFTDIEGFTPIVEEADTDVVLEALGAYLEEMNVELATHHGTVSQYLGDAIMAFWNAPVAQKDHAVLACRAALAMRDRVHALIAAASERGHPPLPTRFGLNTGEVMVGNIGARSRFNYNALGDPVNVASRIEGLNKEYGTEILIGERTAELVEGAFLLRPLDWVRMKGKANALQVFELIGPAGSGDAVHTAGLAAYAAGLAAYRAGDFAGAVEGFDACHAALGDRPSAVMADRSRALHANPPAAWDGVFVMTHK